MADYEPAMRNAILTQYPNRELRARRSQAIKRNALKIAGLVNISASSIYYIVMCLPLMPPDMIAIAFDALKKKTELIEAAVFHNFMNYVERQWIKRRRVRIS